MDSWKTWVMLLALLTVAYVLYPRASGGEAGGGAAGPGGAKREEVVLWMPVSATESLRTAVEAFERENPRYRVVLGAATVRDATSDPTRFLLGVAGGSPPDVIFFDRYAVVEWAARGAFKDLNGYLAADAARADGVHERDIFAAMWDEPRFKGKQYGIPNSVDIRALFINDDLLVRAGFVNADGSIRPPRTWEDVCRKIFHGGGRVTGDKVHLGQPGMLPGVGAFPVSAGVAKAGDVVTLRSGQDVFRARIAAVDAAGEITLDFGREQPPGTKGVPAAIARDQNVEVKVFDGNSYAIAMTRYDEKGNMDVAGFTPLAGNSWLYMYGWQNGATFLSEDGERILLDQPAAKVALQFIVDCYDALGGYKKVSDYESAQNGSPLHPFLAGKVAMRIDGDWFLGSMSAFKSDLRFTVVPAPIPEARLAAGFKPITWAGGWAYAIPSTAKHQDGAWELIRYLSTERAVKLQAEVNASRARASGQVYMPGLTVIKNVAPWLRETYMVNNPAVSKRSLAGYETFLALLPEAKFRPITPVGQKLWEAQKTAQEQAIAHASNVHEALTDRTRWAQESLDRFLYPPTGPRVNWAWLIGGYTVLLGIGGGLLAWSEVRRRRAKLGRRDWRAGFACVSPWLLGFIIFGGGPILFSLIISFCRFDVLNPAQFVGFDNYAHLLGFHKDALTGQVVANDPDLWKSLANTAFMLVGVPVGIAVGLLLAMLLNQTFRGIALFRTIYYVPSIVPAVASFLLWVWIFDPKRGLLNSSLMGLGVDHPPAWLNNAAWSKPALILMGLWGVGGGMLIWLAGLKSIPAQLYEAAEIDGAGVFRRFFNVTLPMLSPYIFFNTVMGIIGTLQVFEAAFIMTDGGPEKSTMFYAYYLFNQAFRYLDMGAASAMAWILFAIVLTLTLLQGWLSRKWVHYD